MNTPLPTSSTALRMLLKELPAGSPEWHRANNRLMQVDGAAHHAALQGRRPPR